MIKIIAGQLMLWSNLVFVVIGFLLFKKLNINDTYLEVLLGVLGVTSSLFNLFIAICLQLRGYKDKDILEFE